MTINPTLQRSLNLPLVMLYGLGNILGAGIYVLIGKVAGQAGYFAPLSFLFASVIAGITAFSFCELSSRFPVSAGGATYVRNGFNIPQLTLGVGILIILTGVVSAATISRGFTGYIAVFIDLPDELVIISLLTVLCLICVAGIVQSVALAAVFTVIEVAGLLLILASSAPYLNQLPETLENMSQPLTMSMTMGIFGGAFIAFYAYIGFEDMVNLAEEVKNPSKTLPIAILLALFIASVIYALLSLSSLLVMTPGQLRESTAPMADIYQLSTGNNPWFISIVSLFAVVNGALIQIIMGSRVTYGLANQGLIPATLGKVDQHTQTPIVATVLVSIAIVITALWLPVETLAKTTTYLLLLLFCQINLSLIRIKRREGPIHKGFEVPIAIPIAGFTSCALFLVVQSGLLLWSLI